LGSYSSVGWRDRKKPYREGLPDRAGLCVIVKIRNAPSACVGRVWGCGPVWPVFHFSVARRAVS
jgi:hypothetical protein